MKSNYGFGEDQVKATQTSFPQGEQVSNVEIPKCEYVSGTTPSGTTWEAIDMYYERDGATIKDRMFKINRETTKARSFVPGDTDEDAYDDKCRILNTQLLQVATKLGITRETLQEKCRVTPFSALAEDYCKLINANCKGKKLYLKTMKDGGYTKVSRDNSNTVPFVQSMDESPCTLQYTKKELAALEKNTQPQNGVSGAVKNDWVSRDTL